MILLLGGTSETGPIAARLTGAGCDVLVSTLTDEPLTGLSESPPIAIGGRLVGPLSDSGLDDLIAARNVRVIVDATHPYAARIRASARRAADRAGIAYLTFIRPAVGSDDPQVTWADDHEHAARLAFAVGKTVLLTTGSNNLAPYVAQSRLTGIALVARVLDRAESISACRQAGLSDERIIAAKGPFTVEQNREHIRRLGVGVLVSKDSGRPGGVEEKLAAARLEACRVIMVRRPPVPDAGAFDSLDALVAAAARLA